jgi:hypothetical protein
MPANLATRIAISASLLWMLAVTAVAAFDFVPGLPSSGVFLTSVERERTPDELALRTDEERKAEEFFGPPRVRRFDVVSYRNWLLLPLAIFWLFGSVAYGLLRWISAARSR